MTPGPARGERVLTCICRAPYRSIARAGGQGCVEPGVEDEGVDEPHPRALATTTSCPAAFSSRHTHGECVPTSSATRSRSRAPKTEREAKERSPRRREAGSLGARLRQAAGACPAAGCACAGGLVAAEIAWRAAVVRGAQPKSDADHFHRRLAECLPAELLPVSQPLKVIESLTSQTLSLSEASRASSRPPTRRRPP